jgi:hypothetical protein
MPACRTAILDGPHPGTPVEGIVFVAAGTADLGPAREAARTLPSTGKSRHPEPNDSCPC